MIPHPFKCFEERVAVGSINGVIKIHPTVEVFIMAEAYVQLWPAIYNTFHQYVRYISRFKCDFYQENVFLSSSGCSM